jgi:Ion channel
MADEGEERFFGAREGWTLRQRFFALDSYGLLLPMILLSLIVASIEPEAIHELMPLIRTVVLVGTLAFALHTSGASRRTYLVCAGLAVFSLVVAIVVDPDTRLGGSLVALCAFLLVVAVLATVIRRFGVHPVVTGSSILAAICIYVFLGLAFATIYGFDAAAGTGPLFASGTDGTPTIRIYFSYITLTTVGYGDFVPGGDVTRMIAATEALMGQVYLVTVVALLVSNVGAQRRLRRAPPPDDPQN